MPLTEPPLEELELFDPEEPLDELAIPEEELLEEVVVPELELEELEELELVPSPPQAESKTAELLSNKPPTIR